MTDQELIKALRCCTSDTHCHRCADECVFFVELDMDKCIPEMGEAVADRLEALLADNAALGQEIDRQICKRSELEREIGRLEVERDHFRDLTKKMWCEKQYGEDTNVPTKRISKYAGLQGMTAAQWNAHGPHPIYCGDLPCVMTHDEEPPSTEGVD